MEQVPTKVLHVSYTTGQIAHDLRIMHKFFLRYMPSSSGLLNELPKVHGLLAELKMAKPGTPEASIVENRIKTVLEVLAGQVLRARFEQERLLNGILENADRVHKASKNIGCGASELEKH